MDFILDGCHFLSKEAKENRISVAIWRHSVWEDTPEEGC